MTRAQSSWIIVAATVLLAAVIAGVARWTTPENQSQFADAATLLAFVTAAAVGIERTIETGWTIVGSLAGTFWPLNAVSKQVDTFVDDLDGALAPFHKTLADDLQKVEGAVDRGADWLKSARDEIAQLEDSFQKLKNQPRDPQRIHLLTVAAARNVSYLRKKYPEVNLETAEKVANEAIDGLQDFIGGFKDNPGRRLISLYVGAIIGLIVAGIFELDLFRAALDPTDPGASPLTAHPQLNIVLTGIVIGLGSGPTHEVIRLVQEHKERQKGANVSTPEAVEGPPARRNSPVG